METQNVGLIIAGMIVVTTFSRWLPIFLLANRQLPRQAQHFLDFAAPAILSAMLFPALIVKQGAIDLSWANNYLWIALPTWLVAYKTKNIAYTVLSGVLLLALWRQLM